ncbi:hypothetical protein [Pseudomonas fluorescens]|uniref:Uncharacterized protein n=1 Tax=Pseudomonas fluorescens TaxID=294 RepID=A0A109KMZ6_PSEFL|nr:hypothetical protein [Pseudomonas fluorescens]KWV72182.1 hypothetical protein PFL603g_04723 [Pseudomonas fluorescens]
MTNKKRAKRKSALNSPAKNTASALDNAYEKKSFAAQVEYKPNSVKGKIHDLSRKRTGEAVLYIATNHSQVEMAFIMSESSQYESYIYCDEFDFYDLSLDYKRAKVISSITNVSAILKNITRAVTYIGQVNAEIKKSYRSLISALLKLEIPIVEVPHGLIQSGYNLDDDSRVVDLGSFYDGIGESLPSIASARLNWYGEGSIGYPRYTDGKIHKKRVVPNFTVITTNTNWYLYSIEDKRNFFRTVFKFAEKHPERMFIWSPHPAEMISHAYSFHVLPLRPANVLLYGLLKDIYFNGIEGTNDLIAHCESGISTVSTCLLDYEMGDKPVLVFNPDGVESICESFESCQTFRNLAEIAAGPGKLVTGMLEKYDPARFDLALIESPKSSYRDAIFLDLAQ